MTRFAGILAAAILLMGCQQGDASAQLSEMQREEVRDIVRDYILENPEIIEEALIELQRRARARVAARLRPHRCGLEPLAAPARRCPL